MMETARTEMNAAISPGIRENAPLDDSALSKPLDTTNPDKVSKTKKKKVKTEVTSKAAPVLRTAKQLLTLMIPNDAVYFNIATKEAQTIEQSILAQITNG